MTPLTMKTLLKGSMVLLCSIFVGCASNSDVRYTQNNIDKDPRIMRIKYETSKHIYLPCTKDQTTQCADLTDKHFQDHEEHVKKYCNGKKSKKCNETLSTMLAAQWNLRYDGADWNRVTLICTANPEKCEGLSDYEEIIAESHNQHYVALMNEQLDQVYRTMGQERQAEQQERKQRMANALGQIGAGLQGNPTRTCTSKPDGFGGVKTVCQND
ncbi:MAG: hypothetical protein ABIO95_00720 [Bdellovibrionota bacterium]